MHNVEDDNFICEAVGKVSRASDNDGYGFIGPTMKVVEHGNGNAYVPFEQGELVYLLNSGRIRDAFAHYKYIISDASHRRLYEEDVVSFKLYNGRKGLYAVEIKKIDSKFDENGYLKDLSVYGITQN